MDFVVSQGIFSSFPTTHHYSSAAYTLSYALVKIKILITSMLLNACSSLPDCELDILCTISDAQVHKVIDQGS